MQLRSIAHDDPQIKKFKDIISRYTAQIEPFGFTYRVYLTKNQPVGIAFIGQEPFQLLEPVGTPFVRFNVIDYDQSAETLNAFADAVMKLAKKHKVHYAYLNIPVEQQRFAEHLEQIGFKEFANRSTMSRPLDEIFEVSDQLRYEQITREEVNQFFLCLKAFMRGSPDHVAERIFHNFRDVPEVMLDEWYKMVQAYFVYHNKDLIGILDLVPQMGFIQNIAVAPVHRRKGHASEMLRFCLKLFKDCGSKKANLGVHVDNKQAIKLYKKLGFSVDRQIQIFIWWKSTKPDVLEPK